MKRRNVLIILGVVGVLLVLCVAVASLGGGPKPTPTPPQPTAALPPTPTAQPAATKPPASTATPMPPTATKPPVATATKPAAQIGKVGEAVTASGVALTVEKVGRDKGTLTLAVLIENVGNKEAQPYNPFYFKIKDAAGYEYSATIAWEQALSSGNLAQGEKARGNVAFSIPDTAKGLVLTYQPIVIFGGYTIKINLGQ